MTDELQNVLGKCPAGMAARLIGISVATLHNWRRSGKVKAVQTPAGKYVYDVRPFVEAKAGKAKR